MAFHRHIAGYLKYGKETTYGNAVATTKYLDLTDGYTPKVTRNMNRIAAIGGGHNYAEQTALTIDATGNFSATLQDGSIWEYAFGKNAEGGSYTHTMTEYDPDADTDNCLPSMTIEYGWNSASGDSAFKLDGAKVNNITLDGAVGDVSKCSVDVIGRKVTTTTTGQTSSLKTTDPYKLQKCSLLWNNTTVDETQNLSFSMANNLEPVRGIGNTTDEEYIQNLVEKTASYGITFNSRFEDFTEYNDFVNATERTAVVNLIRTVTTDIAVFTLSNVVLYDFAAPIEAGGGEVFATFMGYPKSAGVVFTDSVQTY